MHIVWDWNGTLLSDIDAVVDAANSQFIALGAPTLELDAYRDRFARPVRAFNEQHLGRELTDAEWQALDAGFHRHYWGAVGGSALAEGAEVALAAAESYGWTQSLLSMAPDHHIQEIVRERGLSGYFSHIEGNRGEVGAAKAGNLRAHLAEVGAKGAEVWLIGDAVDDAIAAAAVGARSVLVSHASCHSPAVLAATGAPVVDSVGAAVAHIRAAR